MSADLKVSDILVGDRDRQEFGDIDELAHSIENVGLLHPVVITEDAELVAGGRRLEAVKRLGWEFVPVTVVTLETLADVLQAEADENTCRKSLTPYEASRARERRAKLLAPKAAERKGGRPAKKTGSNLEPVSREVNVDEANHLSRQHLAELDAASVEPSDRKTRNAASAGTGYSASTLDKVDRIRDIAERGVIKKGKDEIPAPVPVVEIAKKALDDVKQTGAAVERSSRDLNAAVEAYVGADPDVQRARLAKSFSEAMGSALKVAQFDTEAIAAVLDSDDWDTVEQEFEALAKFWRELKSHRTQGLRLVGGTHV